MPKDSYIPEHLLSLMTLNVDLTNLNSMRLSSCGNRVFTLTDEKQVFEVVKYLKDSTTKEMQSAQPLFILSGGSNVLLPPVLKANIIRPLMRGINIVKESDTHVDIEVMAGENWHDLVVKTVQNGWYGLENLALIPGLTGAAPVQNIGAYGKQLEDNCTHVNALHLPSLQWRTLSKEECDFSYRDSMFKRQSGDWLITRVGFRLHKNDESINANYGDVAKLAKQLAQQNEKSHITPIEVMNAIIYIRQQKLPDPKQLPNCGSFFKNPIILTSQFEQLQNKYEDIVGYRVDEEHTKVAAGWLIDRAGLKGGGIEPILTHTQQALVLVNHAHLQHQPDEQATQGDVLATQEFIQQRVEQDFGILLEREPVWID